MERREARQFGLDADVSVDGKWMDGSAFLFLWFLTCSSRKKEKERNTSAPCVRLTDNRDANTPRRLFLLSFSASLPLYRCG